MGRWLRLLVLGGRAEGLKNEGVAEEEKGGKRTNARYGTGKSMLALLCLGGQSVCLH